MSLWNRTKFALWITVWSESSGFLYFGLHHIDVFRTWRYEWIRLCKLLTARSAKIRFDKWRQLPTRKTSKSQGVTPFFCETVYFICKEFLLSRHKWVCHFFAMIIMIAMTIWFVYLPISRHCSYLCTCSM